MSYPAASRRDAVSQAKPRRSLLLFAPMFALAAIAAFVYPEGQAGKSAAIGGFVPAQVPLNNSPNPAQYRSPLMCADLGGTLQEVDGEWVCKGLDLVGTFCIVGSANLFPCHGLFRHVIRCNDAYNRPARDPFICGAVCGIGAAGPPSKARGANCEYVYTANEILPETEQIINLPVFPDGYIGVLATLQVSAPEFQGAAYDDFVLINHRPLGPGADNPRTADQLTIAAGNVLRIPEYAPLSADETSRMLVAKNSCPDPAFQAAAGLRCYPVFVTVVANFQQVVRRTDIVLNSVAANLPAAVVTLETAVGHSGFGFDLSLRNTTDYALTDLAYDANVHGFDPVNGVILIDPPIQAGSPIVADVRAGVECRAIPYCNPARFSVTVVFKPLSAPAQAPVNANYLDGFTHSIALPAGYEGGGESAGRVMTMVGMAKWADDLANLSLSFNGDNLKYAPGGEGDNTLDAGQYIITVAMTQRDLLGTMYLKVPAEIAPRAPDAEYALANLTPNRITVAAGYDGALYEVSLSAVSAVIELPSDYPEGFTMALSPDSRRATLLLDSAVSGGLERVETISPTVVRLLNGAADANYAPLAQSLRFTVLSLPALATVSLAGMATEFVPYANPFIYDFRAELGGVYAEADFGKEHGAAELTISREGIVSSFSDIASPGVYTLVATAAAATYLGAARAALELSLFSEKVSVSHASIPADGARGTLSASGLDSREATALFGATVTFTAAPAEFNYVAGWSSPRCASGSRFVSENAECAFVATTAISLSAEFRPLARRIELSVDSTVRGRLSASSGGSVLVGGAEVPHGARVTFTAAPEWADEGLYYVSSWTREPFGGGSAEPVCETEIGGPSNTTLKRCALTVDRDMRVAAEFDLARERLDSRLSIAVLHRDAFDAELVGLLLTLGADANQTSANGEALLLRAARNGKHLAVSILITAGADPAARTPETNHQVPHLAARGTRLEVLRHYIAAVGQVGYSHDWNARSGQNRMTPLGVLQSWHGDNRSEEARETAALIYERGGRCVFASGHYCSIPSEERNPVIADGARGDVFTIVARDFGAAEFDLSLPEGAALTILASIGWTLRVDAAEHPHRAILGRSETTSKQAAVFTITAQYDGDAVRHYIVSARLAGAEADPNAALEAELSGVAPDSARIAELLNQGADVNHTDDGGEALLLRMARADKHLAVSILITLGADPEARTPTSNRQVPHWAARDARLEVLRYYIAAIGLVGHSHDWNNGSDIGTPLNIFKNWHGGNRSAEAREFAALIYERGGRCGGGGGFYCDNVPTETRTTVIADDARGDVFTIVARDFGAAEFTLSLPEAEARTILASIGWTLRLDAAERPRRVVLERGETTSKQAAVFTITAQYDGDAVRRYIVSARLAGAEADPDAALAAEMTMLSPSASLAADLVSQGADTEQANNAGDTLLLQAARNDRHSAVSILIAVGANPDARTPANSRQVPHWATRRNYLESLRHYIAAIGQVGRSYDWNDVADAGTPLGILQGWHGSDRSAGTREMAALIYERGGRCQSSISGFYCDTVPTETRNTVIADDARGDVFTIVARDLGAAEFDLSLPEAEALTVLASIGWTLRLETERPRRVVLTRGETARKVAAVFTITAQYGGTVVRHYRVSARLASAADDPDAALAAEVAKDAPDLARIADLANQGANVNQMDNAGEALLLQAARAGKYLAVSVLIILGAHPDARSPGNNRQVPHWAAFDGQLELLRHYIAAIGQFGHSHDWNDVADGMTSLDGVQSGQGSRQAERREMAALIYERGGRCAIRTGAYCNVPSETRNAVIADDARGDVLTIIARDFGAAQFDLSLPDENALTALASIGLSLRLQTKRPQRIVAARNDMTMTMAAVFTVMARNGGTIVRHYITRLDSAANLALAAEVAKDAPDLARIADLAVNQGADVNQMDNAGEALLLQAARAGKHLVVSVLITLGADPDARSPGNNRQVPHWAAREGRLEVLRHYIAAIGQFGHSYDWNNVNGSYGHTPLDFARRSPEMAALIYERGGRCAIRTGGYCNVPSETRNAVIADDARGDVFTLVARDFGAARFDLSLPEGTALTTLASIGWTLRLDAAERPRRAVLARGETTNKRAAVFTITAQYGGTAVRHYRVSARLASAADDPDAALAAEVAKDAPDLARIADLANQGANVNQANNAGEALLLQAARAGKYLAVSVLIILGAHPDARSPGNNRQVPHWAAFDGQLELLRHYIAAIGQVGHYSYDWNDVADGMTSLDGVQSGQGSRQAERREMAALIYERGGRCARRAGDYCNVPSETRNAVIADDARGNVLTIVARDLGAAMFDLSPPDANALTVLASIGWTLRLDAAERPQRAVLARGETTNKRAAVFTITAQYGGTAVRHYRVSARLASAADDPDAALAAEVAKDAPDPARIADLANQGANVNQANHEGEALLLQAARAGKYLAVSVLITLGADPDARSPENNRQVPHWAVFARRGQLEVEALRHYIAAIGQVGHSYDWNNADRNGDTPLDRVQLHQGVHPERLREMAALIYERGGRCAARQTGAYCGNVPSETRNPVIADDAQGDVLTVIARDFGAAQFDLSPPDENALTVLASIGLSLRLQTERPQRIVAARNDMTMTMGAVFTITARNNGTDVRHYIISARLESAGPDLDLALAAEVAKDAPDPARIADLANQGANVNQANHEGEALLLQAARVGKYLAVSVLITLGADPDARSPKTNFQVPHLAVFARRGQLEALRHYIAAIGQVGHSYDWNNTDWNGYTPLDSAHASHRRTHPVELREMAELIYERGGRCVRWAGIYCNVPLETRNTVIADDTRGDVLTIVARDFGAAEFTLSLPEPEARTVLASIGWTLRLDAAEHPHRVVLERGETTSKQAAMFTITAQYEGATVRHYIVSARLAGAEADPNAALAEELAKDAPDSARIAELLNQGADVEALLLRMARDGKHLAVSILITLGADPDARSPASNRQVPHWAAHGALLEVLRYYIAAAGQVGHSYDWNDVADAGTPLGILHGWHGSDRSARARETAELIYERGGRCQSGISGFYCDNVPTETRNTVIADDARGDVLTIVARDFGAAEFDLSLPEADELTVLASAGWTLRLETERPRRVVLTRGETARKVAAVFTITAQYGGTVARHYRVSARLASAVDDPDAALAAEMTMLSPSASLAADLANQGADTEQADSGGETLLLQAARNDRHPAVSILIAVGANPDARSPTTNRQVPHWAARNLRLEVLRHYIAAIGRVGHSYDWSSSSDVGSPLFILQFFHGSDRSAEAREVAALIYERGGRCPGGGGFYCDNVPAEARVTVIADNTRRDVFTIVARDFGAAEFDLALPEADALAALASVGWLLRREDERPQRIILEQNNATLQAAAFTITARNGGTDVRHYKVEAVNEILKEAVRELLSEELAAELGKGDPQLSVALTLLSQGATLRADLADKAGALAIQAAIDNMPRAVSILITAGANPDARRRQGGINQQIPHVAAERFLLEVLRHYISAIDAVGHAYDWNSNSTYDGTPYEGVHISNRSDVNGHKREIAALLYERGSRCVGGLVPGQFPNLDASECDVPSDEQNLVIADAARGDVFTIVARDFSAAVFDLSLPEADELTVLASIGLSLRFETERPQRIVVARNDMTMTMAAVFTITARNGGTDVRHYIISAGVEGASGFAPPTTTPGKSAADGLRTANLSRNPVLSRSLSRSGVEPPTGTIHPRESRGTEDRRQKSMSWRLSGFGIAWEYLAGVDRSELVPVLVPVGG